MTDSTTAENEREYRLINQMMTAHAVLRDRFSRRALILNISLLALAIILNAFVFASDDTLKILFFGHTTEAKVWIGAVSVVLLILVIIEFRVDWEGQSRSHKEAVERLGQLKANYREAYAGNGKYEELTREYARTMAMLPSIPEKSFIRLKAYHKFKRLLSEELDAHPGLPAWLVRTRLRWRIIRGQISPSNKTHG
jgi:hypothetical protein